MNTIQIRPPASGTWEISEWRPFVKNTLQAFCSITLPSGLILRGCTFHIKNDSRWIGMPAREYVRPDGVKAWMPLVEFADKESHRRFQEQAVKAIEKFLAGGAQ